MNWLWWFRMLLTCEIGGGSKSAPATSSTTTQLQYSPEEAARRANVMSEAEKIYAAAPAPGATAPGAMSAETKQSQDMMRNLMFSSAVPGMGQQLASAQNTGFSAMLDPTSAPGFQQSLDTATRRVNEAYTGPSGPFANIRSGFTASNSGGAGTREGIAMGMAGRDYLNTIGDVTGKLTSDAYGRATDLFAKTMAMAPQTMGAVQGSEMFGANIEGAIGQQKEGYQANQQLWDMNAPWMQLAPYANVVSGMSNPATVSTSTSAPAQAQRNPMQPIGMAMQGAMLGSAIPGLGTLAGAGIGLALGLFS